MRNGDISNELPKRILVTTDVFLNVELTVQKRFRVIPLPKIKKVMRREILSYLYVTGLRKDFNYELVSYELNEEQLSETMDELDKMGTNPFRYYSAYDSINHLVAELPYRPEVTGVLDVQANLLRYGHWGLDINGL